MALIGSIIVANSFIILSQGKDRVFFSNWTINITAAIALALAVITVYRQKLDGLYGKTYASLAIGLGLWFIAEIIWTYFELGLQINTPFPSIADLFWLVGYGFFAYHLYRIYNFMSRETIKPTTIILVSVTIAIALGYLVNLTTAVSDISYSQKQQADDIVLLLISVAYPILDGVLARSSRSSALDHSIWTAIVYSLDAAVFIYATLCSGRFRFWICCCIGYRYSTKRGLGMGYILQCWLSFNSSCFIVV